MMRPLFLPFFSTEAGRICVFFVGRRPFWGFFGLSKARGLAKAKKAPKRPKACRKTQTLKAEVEKKRQKSGQIINAGFLFI